MVYLTTNPGSGLIPVDDVTGEEHRTDIVAGRLCCWPNIRFSHKVGAAGAIKAQGRGYHGHGHCCCDSWC
jgi:hypothetical protein